jgi:uncharacterized membrane protein
MFFVYGLAIVLEPVHNKIRGMPIVIRGGVYAVLILLIEYSTGLFLLKLIGECPWDYGSGRYTINGITRIDYAPIWGMVGLLFEKLHDGLTLPKMSKQTE